MAIPEDSGKAAPLVTLPECKFKLAPPSPYDYGPIVTVVVGTEPNTQNFHIHKGLLQHYSSYFRAALNKNWKEGTENTINLTEDEPEVFRVVFHWLMSGGKMYPSLDEDSKIPISLDLAFKLYIFGDMRGMPELCNTVMDITCQILYQQWKVPRVQLCYIYENTRKNSALRRVVVDFPTKAFLFRELKDGREETLAAYPKEYLAEVLVLHMDPNPASPLVLSRADWVANLQTNVCSRYHQHSQVKEE